MKITNFKELSIPDVHVIQYERFSDKRGYFSETFRESDLDSLTIRNKIFPNGIKQSNESYSRRNVLRGLHFQWNPLMGKLVRTISGHMIDIILDLRLGSPTQGKLIAYDMPVNNGSIFSEWIWVPPGCAHGNFFLEDSHIEYLCSGEYNGDCEAGINPFSEDIDWSICDKKLFNLFNDLKSSFIVSSKDTAGLSLNQWLTSLNSNQFKF
jgi:dTDP-4-dehydrorhamnose 3,5-epimerase